MGLKIWTRLLLKDVVALRTSWLIFLAVIVLGGGGLLIGLASGAAAELVGIALVFVTGVIALHFVLTPIYTFRLLRREWRTTAPLWLQVPMRGWLMLLGKLVVSLLSVSTTWIAAALLAYGELSLAVARPTLFRSVAANPHHLSAAVQAAILSAVFPRLAAFGLVAVLAVGTYLSVWVMLVMLAIKATRHRLGRTSILLAFVLVLVPTWGLSALRGVAGFRAFMAWGPLRLPLGLRASPSYWPLHVPHSIAVAAIGSTIFYAAVAAAVLLASGWLLDREVEI